MTNKTLRAFGAQSKTGLIQRMDDHKYILVNREDESEVVTELVMQDTSDTDRGFAIEDLINIAIDVLSNDPEYNDAVLGRGTVLMLQQAQLNLRRMKS